MHILPPMRTTIDIDDRLMIRALKVSGLPTKKAVIEAALQLLIDMRKHSDLSDLFVKIPIDHNLQRSRRNRRG